SDVTLQTKAKTHPTIRELLLAKKMGAQGVAASLCPIHTTDNATKSDPLYGYRPAVNAIVDTIKVGFITQCVPHKLIAGPDKKLPCLALEIEPKPGPQSACDAIPGRKQPDGEVLTRFRAAQKERVASGAPDTSQLPVCEIVEIPTDGASCKHADKA